MDSNSKPWKALLAIAIVVLLSSSVLPFPAFGASRQISDLSVNSVGPMTPGGYHQAGNYAVYANISNMGATDASVDATLTIFTNAFVIAFTNTASAIVPAGGSADVTFASWSATDGEYYANVSLPQDMVLTNNFINFSFTIYTPTATNDIGVSAPSATTLPAEATNITVGLTNLGTSAASGFNVSLSAFISDSPVIIEDSGIPNAVNWSFEDLTNRSSNWKKFTTTAHSGASSYASKSTTTSYGNNIEDTFVSPTIDLSGTTNPKLTFWQNYSTEGGHDGGYVQVRNAVGDWVNIVPTGGYTSTSGTSNRVTPDGTPVFGNSSGGWVQAEFSLAAFVGLSIAFRFFFTSDDAGTTGYFGWFIDDINVSDGENVLLFDDAEGETLFTPCYIPTGNFWHIEQNAYTPSPAWVCSDSTGNYRNFTEQSLLSPVLNMSSYTTANLSFDHRCDVLTGDHGSVQISSNGGASWVEALNVTDVTSWTHVSIDLMPYISSNVRIRFKFHSSGSSVSYGWLIDNIRVNGTRFQMLSQQNLTYAGTLDAGNVGAIVFSYVPPFEETIQFSAQAYLAGDENAANDVVNFYITFATRKDFAITRLTLPHPSYPCAVLIDFAYGHPEVRAAVENAGVQCDVWNVSDYGAPTSHLLDSYSLVIMAVDQPLAGYNATTARSLKTYLSHGGRAIVFGRAASFLLSLADAELVNNYFKVAHYSNASDSIVLPVAGSIGANAFALTGQSDVMRILGSQASPCFEYANMPSPNSAAVQVDGGVYRCAMFGFELTSLHTNVIANAIDFLGLTNVRYPAGYSLGVNATIRNIGNVFAGGQVEFSVEDLNGTVVYSELAYVYLAPMEETTSSFSWTVANGSYVVKAASLLAEHLGSSSNNELSARVFGGDVTDGGISSVYAVPSGVAGGYRVHASVTNFGTTAIDSSNVHCRIVNASGVAFFDGDYTLGSIAPRSTASVVFDEWVPSVAGVLYANVNFYCASDEIPDNDYAGTSLTLSSERAVEITCDAAINNTHKGGSAVFELKLRNVGNIFDRYFISATGNNSFTITPERNYIGIDIGRTESVNITITAPIAISSGEYPFKIDVRSTDEPSFVNSTFVSVVIDEDLVPELVGYVTPQSGDIETIFTFYCTYTDFEGSPPSYMRLVINGTNYDMSALYANDTTYTDGKTYIYRTMLSSAVHSYSFQTSDGINTNSTQAGILRVTKYVSNAIDWLAINGTACGSGNVVLETLTGSEEAPSDYSSIGLLAGISQANLAWDSVTIRADYSVANVDLFNESSIALFYYNNGWYPFSGTVDVNANTFTTTLASLPNCQYIGLFAKPDSNQPPVADAGASIIKGLGEQVTFDGSSSWDDHLDTLQYFWDFGDGSNATGKVVSHVYAALGTYSVVLTVTDDAGKRSSDTTTVAIIAYNKGPSAEAGKDATIRLGQAYKFDASRSTDPEGDALNYTWDFGDKTIGYGVAPTHKYTTTGKFRVRLFVTDGQNNATDYLTVTVEKADSILSDTVMLLGAVVGVIGIVLVAIIVARMVSRPKTGKEDEPEYYKGKPKTRKTEQGNLLAQEYLPQPIDRTAQQAQQTQPLPTQAHLTNVEKHPEIGGVPGPVEYSSPKPEQSGLSKDGVNVSSYVSAENVKEYGKPSQALSYTPTDASKGQEAHEGNNDKKETKEETVKK